MQIIMLLPTPLQVGGGWSHEVLGGSGSTAPSSFKKRLSDALAPSNGSSKWQHMEVVVEDNMATKPEMDDEPVENTKAFVHMFTQHFDPSVQPPQCGTHPPPPSLATTLATILEAQLSDVSSHSLGSSIPLLCSHPVGESPSQHSISAAPLGPEPKKPKAKPPNILYPNARPTHCCLCAELWCHFHVDTDHWAKATDATTAAQAKADEALSNDVNEVPETETKTETETETNTSQHAMRGLSNPYMYGSYCSHVPSEPINTNTADAPIRPNSPSITPSELI
ncbi:hypothetical protein FRC11_000388 [Ceratobasidium sp. 423]|nr:hypothetical protein FRC11_000388 [Ceratobasidium sp. 423]